MKNKIAIAAAFCAASSLSFGEIVINEFLSFEGFIDMSYVHYDGEADFDANINGTPLSGDVNESGNSYQVDQVEISWLFDFDPVTAQIDLQFEDVANSSSVDEDSVSDGNTVEQAFATYHFDGGSAITAGRYASMLGFEAFEPTGLYQYSFAYGLPTFVGDFTGLVPGALSSGLDLVVGTIFPLPLYSQGVKYTYDGENTFFGVSVQDGVYSYGDRLGGDIDSDGGGYGFEIAGAYYMDNGISLFAGFAWEEGDGYEIGGTTATGDTEAWIFNTYATYETGDWIFAVEVNYGENEWDDVGISGLDVETESLSGLVMANFAYSEKASVTGRFSYVDYELEGGFSGVASGDIEIELFKYTLAHSYAFTDNLVLVTEVSYTDGEADAGIATVPGNIPIAASLDGDIEELLGAVELIFSF